jgi:hypothetical protein
MRTLLNTEGRRERGGGEGMRIQNGLCTKFKAGQIWRRERVGILS